MWGDPGWSECPEGFSLADVKEVEVVEVIGVVEVAEVEKVVEVEKVLKINLFTYCILKVSILIVSI